MRVLVCDDHYITLVGIETILKKAFTEMIHIQAAISGNIALDLLSKNQFDYVVLDLILPDQSGLEILKQIKSHSPETRVIILSGTEDARLIQQAAALRANAIIRKSNTESHLLEAFQAHTTEFYLDPFSAHSLKKRDGIPLSPREFEVVMAMTQGLTSQEIADKFNCSLATIKTHRMRIMNKCGARNSSELLAWFLTNRNANSDYCP